MQQKQVLGTVRVRPRLGLRRSAGPSRIKISEKRDRSRRQCWMNSEQKFRQSAAIIDGTFSMAKDGLPLKPIFSEIILRLRTTRFV